ncbi:MAG: hypothetical protein RLZZ324_817 [Candidatus Parcubacteria bacterium]|jgi:hypothetical protein
MGDIDHVLFPAGAPVIVVGLPHAGMDGLHAFVSTKFPRPTLLTYGKLLEQFSNRNPLSLETKSGIYGIKREMGDGLLFLRPAVGVAEAAIFERHPANVAPHGTPIAQYVIVTDKDGLVQQVAESGNFMSGFETIGLMVNAVQEALQGRIAPL